MPGPFENLESDPTPDLQEIGDVGVPDSLFAEIEAFKAMLKDQADVLDKQRKSMLEVRGALGGISSDDIQIERDPKSGATYWHIPKLEELSAEISAFVRETFPAKILTHAGSGLYTWKEVQANSAYTGWNDTFTGQRGTGAPLTNAPNALESNLDTAVDADTYVLMNEHVDEDGVVGFSFTGGVAIDLTTIDRGDGTSVGGTAGDILYYHSTTKWTRLAAGTTGDVLVMGTTYPEWETPTDC